MLCIHAPTCGFGPALESNGDLYSCDHFVEPRFLLGNIHQTHMQKLVASPEQRKFGQDKRDTLTAQCRRCEVRTLCNGGCPKDRFALSRDGEPGQNYLCSGLELFFTHTRPAMQTMARTAAAGSPALRRDGVDRGRGCEARALSALPLRKRPENSASATATAAASPFSEATERARAQPDSSRSDRAAAERASTSATIRQSTVQRIDRKGNHGGAKKPNILILWGDDIGWWNISYNSRGQMGYRTPNIDRVGNEGVAFTDYYAQQSCTAGRASLHHRPESDPHRPDQGRHARRRLRACRRKTRPSPNC